MHQTILTLVILLLIAQTVLAVVLEDGDYKIYYGSWHAPEKYRYFTAKPNKRDGYVLTYLNEGDDYQIWRLKNWANDQVTLESKGAPSKYLGLRNSDASPGADLGVNHKPVKFRITRKRGFRFTNYELAYPKKVDGDTLVVSLATGDGREQPYFVNLAIQGTEGAFGAFKMSRVSD